jgi:transcriptional regulator with XRE-family HTH domain
MVYPDYVRAKARELRERKRLTIDELGDRLGIPRTTVYYWVRDLPIPRARASGWPESARRKGNLSMQTKYRLLREEAYARGRREFDQLALDRTLRDFVCMYIGEGYKRDRNCVELNNSDPGVVKLAHHWISRFARNSIRDRLQYHADQDVRALTRVWANELGIESDVIQVQRKSNSNGLKSRTWRSRYGVLGVSTGDTALRARLQAWMDCVQEDWP